MTKPVNTPFETRCYIEMHRGVPGDLEFYQAQCGPADSVLELGVGYGRILLCLEAEQLWGLERDPHLLELARRSAAERGVSLNLLEADMASFALGRRFSRILIPYNGLLCLDAERQLECLRRVAQHLQPDGRLVFDIYDADELHSQADDVDAEPDIDEFEFLVDLVIERQRFEVFEQNCWWPTRQRLDVVYELREQGKAALRTTISHHYLCSEQLQPLLEQVGLRSVALGTLDDEAQITVVAALA